MVKEHKHPLTGKLIVGERLCVGTRVLATDLYDSSDGSWKVVGEKHADINVPEKTDVTWIRPA